LIDRSIECDEQRRHASAIASAAAAAMDGAIGAQYRRLRIDDGGHDFGISSWCGNGGCGGGGGDDDGEGEVELAVEVVQVELVDRLYGSRGRNRVCNLR